MFQKLSLALLLLSCANSYVGAQVKDGPKSKWEEAVDRLANKNKPPRIDNAKSKKFAFPTDFDWSEQSRVVKQLNELLPHLADAYPALIKFMDDDRYCLTLEHDMSTQNHSVGEICRDLVLDSVWQSYWQPLSTFDFDKLTYMKFKHDFLPYKHTELRPLLLERQKAGKSLADLEVDACAWAIKELPALTETSEQQQRVSKAMLAGLMAELKSSQKPFVTEYYFHGGRSVYSKEELLKDRDPIDPFK